MKVDFAKSSWFLWLGLPVNMSFDVLLLCLRGLLEGGFSRITTLWLSLIQILSYHDLSFL